MRKKTENEPKSRCGSACFARTDVGFWASTDRRDRGATTTLAQKRACEEERRGYRRYGPSRTVLLANKVG